MSWSALTTPQERYHKDGAVLALPMVDAVTIYAGDLVRITAAGYATSTDAPATGDMFAGVAMETVANTATGHAAGSKNIRVYTSGVFSYPKATPLQEDVGSLVYGGASDSADDQQTVYASTAGAHEVLVGTVVGLDPDNALNVLVKIFPFRAISA